MPEQDKKVLKGILRGRIIRWEQQRTPIQQQMQALLFEFHELAHDGYPLGLIRRLWHSQSDQGPIFHVGLALLTNMAQITSPSERSVGTATLALHACTQIADQATVFENMGYGGGKWGGKGYQNGQGGKGSWGKFGNSPYGGGGGGGGANGGAGSGMSLVRSFQNMCKDMVGLSTIVRVGEALGANGGSIGEGIDNSMLGALKSALPGGQAAQTPPAAIQNVGQPQQPPPLVSPQPVANLEEQLRASPFISGLQEEVKTIREDVGGLGSRMTQQEQAMSSLNQAAKDIKSQNEAILARIDTLGHAPQTAQPPPDAPAPGGGGGGAIAAMDGAAQYRGLLAENQNQPLKDYLTRHVGQDILATITLDGHRNFAALCGVREDRLTMDWGGSPVSCKEYIDKLAPLKSPNQWKAKFLHWNYPQALADLINDRHDVRVVLWTSMEGDLSEAKTIRV